MTLLGPNDGCKASVHALVLAAGSGSRFGGGKLQAQYRGRALLAHVLERVVAACSTGVLAGGHVVVSGQNHGTLDLVRAAGLHAILNETPQLGLSSSLRLGLSTLQSLPEAAAAMIFLGDQPHVRGEVIELLVTAWRGGDGSIIRPRYAIDPDVPGHPVLLSRAVWMRSNLLEGDTGFGGMPEAATLDVPGSNPDVDSPADLQALERMLP